MENQLPTEFANLSLIQRRYCEFRAKGFSQAKAAALAGSRGKDAKVLAKIGYQLEQIPGAGDYIMYLRNKKADLETVDKTDIIEKLSLVFVSAMADKEFTAANKAVEIMAKVAGFLSQGAGAPSKLESKLKKQGLDVGAFKEEDDEEDDTIENRDDRMKRLTSLLSDLQNTKSN